jgi:hypothetical protein
MSRRWAHEALTQLAIDTKKSYDIDTYDGVKRLVKEGHYLARAWFSDFKVARLFVRTYCRRKNHEPYYVLLARSIIHTAGLVVDEQIEPLIGSDTFLEEFRRQLKVIFNHERNVANVDYFCDSLQTEYRQINEEYAWSVYSQQTKSFTALCAALTTDLPSFERVKAALGLETAESYKSHLEMCEDDTVCSVLDVHDALQAGEKKKWNKRQIQRRVEQMEVFSVCVGKNEYEASEMVEEYNRQQHRRSKALKEKNCEQLAGFQVWRVRPYENKKWMERIPDDLWARYLHVENSLKQNATNLIQYIARRHFSEPAVGEFAQNIEALGEVVKFFAGREINLCESSVSDASGGDVADQCGTGAEDDTAVSVGTKRSFGEI